MAKNDVNSMLCRDVITAPEERLQANQLPPRDHSAIDGLLNDLETTMPPPQRSACTNVSCELLFSDVCSNNGKRRLDACMGMDLITLYFDARDVTDWTMTSA